jgi:lysophospholipase III
LTKYESAYFSFITEAFVGAGYVRGKNLTALTYDWRLTPNQQDLFFENMKSTIESFYLNNNNTRVMLLSHSMGCLMTNYFLARMDQQWKVK